jgi:peptidoglycan/LPS O-acetylase OafA/YrhL
MHILLVAGRSKDSPVTLFAMRLSHSAGRHAASSLQTLGMEMIETRSRFAFIDSLRFVAAALVVFQHLFEHRTGFAGEKLVPLGPGVAGVALFFFISGYVIPLSAGTQFTVRQFIVRRLFRIYPLFLSAILLIFGLGATLVLPQWSYLPSAPAIRWFANLALVQDFVGQEAFLGVSWTLVIELIWYGMFAAALMRFGDRAASALDTLLPLSLVAMAIWSLILDARLPIGRPTMIYAAVIGFQCFRHAQGNLSSVALGRSLLVFGVVALSTNYVSFGLFRHPHITLVQSLGPWTLGTVVFLVVLLLEPLRTAHWLNSGLIPDLGAMSYSIYLLHPVAMAAADTYAPDGWRVPVAIGLTAMLSLAGYHLVEKPGIALGRRVARWPGARTRGLAAS